MSWFFDLTGFTEQSPQQVRENIQIVGDSLVSLPNQRAMKFGAFRTPSLYELREEVPELGPTRARQIVADVRQLHLDPANAYSLFQVASQFNCLEMLQPNFCPEDGVAIYEYDRTQGPICAVCAGAGTIYRNYFVPIGDSRGQSSSQQIDCLQDIGNALDNQGQLWEMKNGYCLASAHGLTTIRNLLESWAPEQRDALKTKLRIGIQEETEVTLDQAGHLVNQVYGSALPVAYSRHRIELWETFARLILEASYEAVFWAAVRNQKKSGNNRLFLTLLGGGAFGNEIRWILDAIRFCLIKFREAKLDVRLVSYGSENRNVRKLLTDMGF